jgi:hypothetical protein
MDMAKEKSTPAALTVARHVAGMAVVALMNPMIYSDPRPLFVWLTGWVMALLVASIVFGVYALFFTSRAKFVWPRIVLNMAWVIVVLYAIGGWAEYSSIKHDADQKQQSPEQGPWLEYQKQR